MRRRKQGGQQRQLKCRFCSILRSYNAEKRAIKCLGTKLPLYFIVIMLIIWSQYDGISPIEVVFELVIRLML